MKFISYLVATCNKIWKMTWQQTEISKADKIISMEKDVEDSLTLFYSGFNLQWPALMVY